MTKCFYFLAGKSHHEGTNGISNGGNHATNGVTNGHADPYTQTWVTNRHRDIPSLRSNAATINDTAGD